MLYCMSEFFLISIMIKSKNTIDKNSLKCYNNCNSNVKRFFRKTKGVIGNEIFRPCDGP